MYVCMYVSRYIRVWIDKFMLNSYAHYQILAYVIIEKSMFAFYAGEKVNLL